MSRLRLTDQRYSSAIHHSSGRYAPAPPLSGQFAVALLCGGILTLAGAAYIATRVVHGGHGHATG